MVDFSSTTMKVRKTCINSLNVLKGNNRTKNSIINYHLKKKTIDFSINALKLREFKTHRASLKDLKDRPQEAGN